MTISTGSTGTCARNLPQHFNGCTCTAVPGSTTAEVEIDLTDPWADIPMFANPHDPEDELTEPDESPEPDPVPETVTVLDRHGKPVTLTPGVIDLEAKYAFTAGQCLAYAIATSEKTGWPVYVRMGHNRIGRKRDPQDYVIHAMVQAPDGLLVDINGPREPGSWIESGYEIDAQIIPSDQARGLLKTHMAAMKPQDVDAAAHFVEPMLTEHGLKSEVDRGTADPNYETIDDLSDAGYVTDDWDRWQQGSCAAYAVALVDAHPHLRFAVMGRTERGGGDASDGWRETHCFAHDDHFAYDSAGRHPLPYRGVHGTSDYAELDADPDDFGYRDEFTATDFADATTHAERHQILTRRPVPFGGLAREDET